MTERQHLESVSEEVATLYRRASVLLRRGRFGEASQILDGILELAPGFPPACNKYGVRGADKGDYGEAEEWFAKALSIDREYPPAIVNLGNIALARNDRETAKRHYQKAHGLDRTYAPVHRGLAALCKAEGDVTGFVRHMRHFRRYARGAGGVVDRSVFYREPAFLVPVALGVLILLVYIFAWVI